MGPELSAIVVTYNSAAVIGRCLDSLQAALERWGGRAEVLVVDNASEDGTAAQVQGRPGVRLLPQRVNLGFGAGVNVALRQCAGRYVLLQNPDCFLEEGLEALIGLLDGREAAAAVGPRIVDGDGQATRSCARFPTLWTELCENFGLRALRPRSPLLARYVYPEWDGTGERRVDWLTGACVLLRMEALEEVGPFDEDYWLYTEEVDLQWRLAQAGWESWYLARARVVHLGGQSAGSHRAGAVMEGRLHAEFVKSLQTFFRKRRGPAQARWHRVLLTTAYALRLIRALGRMAAGPGQRGRALARARVFADVLRGLLLGFGAQSAAGARLRLKV
jgi:GT2 family glycosyltransferase